MLGKIFGILTLIAMLFACLSGNITQLGSAVLDGAAASIEVVLSLCGMMCLWCGMMRVLSAAGLISKLARLLSPFLRLFFPEAARTGEGIEEISANISANLLGIGNAATPLALRAMEKMQRHNLRPTHASAEQITLAVLNTASVTLIPANLLALRRAAGSENPYAVMLPIWITSVLCAAMSLLLTAIPRLWEKTRKHTDQQQKRRSYHD